jgi:osmoprotectant transport system substrate-binding protein
MIKRQYRTLVLVLAAALVALAAALPAGACVGKSLVIGSTGTPQQEILAQVLATLISERTGTTVKVVRLDSAAAAHEALLKADLDILVEYTGVARAQVLKGAPIADPEALFQAVKESYNQELNLVWLTPFGFSEPRLATAGMPAQAAPVVRKDTLKKFPALSRLIDKLGGAIDAARMQELEAQAAKKEAREVARGFLRAGKFI